MRALFYQTLRLLVYLFCRIYFRIEFEGAARVPRAGAVIVAPNHTSYLDPIWVSLALGRRLRYMTWDRMFNVPLLGPLMRAFGAFPVKVEKGDRAALRCSLEHLREDGARMIFPEGSRTHDGRLLPFKPGVVRLALAANAPIVPVTIIGGYDAYARHRRFPRPHKVRVIYHEPVRLAPPEGAEQLKRFEREEAARLRRIIAAPLAAEAEIPQAASGRESFEWESSDPERESS